MRPMTIVAAVAICASLCLHTVPAYAVVSGNGMHINGAFFNALQANGLALNGLNPNGLATRGIVHDATTLPGAPTPKGPPASVPFHGLSQQGLGKH
jgi:hypothetical protein